MKTKSSGHAGPSMHDYQSEDDHRTLTRAAEIHGDASRMRGVQKHHRKQTKALASVGSMLGQPKSMSRGRH